MFQQIPPEVVAAVIESAGEMYLNRLARRKMAAVAELNYELQLLLGAALLDEPWTEGEEGESAQRAKESATVTSEESDRPSDSATEDGDVCVKTEPSTEQAQDDEEEDEMSPKGAVSGEPGATEDDEENTRRNVVVKTEPSEDSSSATRTTTTIPKSRKDTSNVENHSNSTTTTTACSNSESNNGVEGKTSSRVGNMEQPEKRVAPSRSRGSNVGDSSELEASETEETDERRISNRRDQDCGSSSRSRTPDRPGSDFGGSPGPFSTHQQQQQFLQAGIPYLHLLPPHIRNDAARLFLMPQMLQPDLAAAAAAAAAASTSTSNQSPSPGSGVGGNSSSNNANTSQPLIPSSSSSSGNSGGTGKSEKVSSGENSRAGGVFVCEPCNIKFSSARTLEAHQTYYCSFRKDAGRENARIEVEDAKTDLMMPVPSACGSSGGSKKRDRENSEEHEMTMDESMESIDAFPVASGSGSKSQKTGKLYSCIYCSYSADKKVSLNRHMRMHSGLSISSTNQMPNANTKDEQGQLSAAVAVAAAALGSRPVTPGKSPSASITSSSKNAQDGGNAMERYCQDCDIQFSSIKTFRVHKQYYCSTRHVLKAQQTAVAAAVAAAAAAVAAGGNPVASAALGKAPVELGPGVTVTPVGKSSASIASACSPAPVDGSPGSTPGPMNSQPFVVLPTNPIIVVPYCFIQGASFLPGHVLPSQNAIVVLPNGSVQSMPGSAGGIPIPVPSPSPQSMMLGSHLMMHSSFPTSATPGPSNTGNGSGIMSPNNLAFPDPKEMMKIMSGSTKESSSRDEDEMMSPSKLAKSHSRSSGRSSRSSDDALALHHHHHEHHGRDQGSDACDESSMPAIDLTFRGIQPKKEQTNGGDEEKENRGEMGGSAVGGTTRGSRNISRDSMSGALEENSRSRSVTPAAASMHHAGVSLASSSTSHHPNIHDSHHHHRESISPLEKMSLGSGSGGKRTPRPSSASVSSSCSTPPALCEPKLNGMMSHIMSPGVKDHHHDAAGLNNKMAMMMMLNAGAAAAAAAALEGGNISSNSGGSRGGKANKGSVDYSSVIEMTRSSRGGGSASSSVSGANGGKISPVATQLPGGAILTSATSNQSLAELLMTNPPELNESLAKLNPQLLMNAHRAASGGSPVGFNFNLNPAFMQALSPEIAMRLLDPAYLSTLQQTIQQQQQQQQQHTSSTPQPPQVPVKRGVSKCIECDIVFYKYENYLVHKEHYCAARANSVAGGVSNTSNNFPPSKSSTSSNSSKSHHQGKGIRDNGNHRGNGKDTSRMSSCSSPSKSELDDDECISPPPPPTHRKGSIHSQHSMRKSPDALAQPLLANKPKTKSPQNAIMSPVSISPVPSPKGFGVLSSHVKDHGKGSSSNNYQFPCSICGVKFSTIDNLQTHQTYYCTKRKAGNTLNSGYDNNGENEYCGGNGESKSGNNNGDVMILGLPTSANSPSPHEKDTMTGGISSIPRGNKSPGSRNGFLRCGKCKLQIPEQQMSTHIPVCLGIVSPSFGGNGGRAGEVGSGWKCPCCDQYSPSVSQAQKHLESHTGIRAFKCLLCGYRGNTLRGMRTHIRTHFDKRVFDLLEADYMTCITANDVEPTASTNSNNNSTNNSNNSSSRTNMSSPPLHPDQIHRAMPSPNIAASSGVVNRSSGGVVSSNEIASGSNNKANSNSKHSRYSPESCKNANQLSKSSSSADIMESSSPNAAHFAEEGSDIKVFHSPSDMMMMTMMTETDSNNSTENNNQLHYCNLCNYSSPFKGNILKHMKLVHKVQIPLDMTSAAEAEAAALMLIHGAAGGDHEGLATMSMIMNRGAAVAAAAEMMMEDVNGASGGESSRNSTPKSTLEYAIAQGFAITSPPAKPLSPAVATTTSSSSMSESCSTMSTRSRRAATAAQNGTTGIPSKEERIITSTENTDAERKCSSHSSAEDDIGGGSSNSSITKPAEKQQQSSSTTTTGSAASSSSTTGGNYCKSCDISFNYVSSFNAHKKFYCSSQVSSDTEAPERAETPVQ